MTESGLAGLWDSKDWDGMRFRVAGTRLGGWALDLSLDHQQRTTYDALT